MPDVDDAPVFDGNVAGKPGISGSIDNPSTANENIVFWALRQSAQVSK
jgi:hypothetical protein